MAQEKYCSSCKRRITNMAGTAQFKCPHCGQTDFIRCQHCREIAAKYKCSQCGFEGPN